MLTADCVAVALIPMRAAAACPNWSAGVRVEVKGQGGGQGLAVSVGSHERCVVNSVMPLRRII